MAVGRLSWRGGTLRQAIQIKSDYAEAYYTLGTVLKQMKQLPEAADSLRQAIRLDPDFAGAHTTLAAVLRQLGDTAGAVAESKAGAEMSKEKTDLQAATFATNSGRRLLNAGDLDGAISQFRTGNSGDAVLCVGALRVGSWHLARKDQKTKLPRNFGRPRNWILSWLLRVRFTRSDRIRRSKVLVCASADWRQVGDDGHSMRNFHMEQRLEWLEVRCVWRLPGAAVVPPVNPACRRIPPRLECRKWWFQPE